MSNSIFISPEIHPCKPAMILNDTLSKYFTQNHFSLVKEPASADYIFVNTCGVTQICEDFSFQKIENLIKTKSKDSKLVVFGCLPKINPEKMKEIEAENMIVLDSIENVDTYFQVEHPYTSIPRIIDNATLDEMHLTIPKTFLLEEKSLLSRIFKKINLKWLKYLIDACLVKNRNLVEISEGCTDHCSFCAIKNAKGDIRSQTINVLMEQIDSLDLKASPLISLVAQDCGAFGIDTKENIYDLLTQIKNKYPQVSFEITTLNPKWLMTNYDFWEKILQNFSIKEITIPLQSGSQKIVNLMNRKYELKEIYISIKKLQKLSPRTFYRTHLICGFPQEKFWDYLQSYKVINHFDHTQILTYFDRPHTYSEKIPGKNPHWLIMLRIGMITIYSLTNTIIKIIIKP